MRLATVLVALGCILPIASGQWLETTIRVPDTFGLPRGERSLAYDPEHQVMFIAGDESDSILVADVHTYRPVERFAVGGPVSALARPSNRSVLFCALCDSDRVIALDCGTHQPVTQYDVGDRPGGMLCCDTLNKLYVANWGDSSISVIDCVAGLVVAAIPGIDAAGVDQGMCYVASVRHVFCVSQLDSAVVVIDAVSDSVVARVGVGDLPSALCYNPANDRVYCACWGDHILYAIDVATDSVVSVVAAGLQTLSLACDSLRNRIYSPNGDELVVVDGSADTVMARVAIDAGRASLVSLDSKRDEVLVAREDGWWQRNGVTVIDGESLTPRRLLPGPCTPCVMGNWGMEGDVFCAGWDDQEVYVFDVEHDRVAGVLADDCEPIGLDADSVAGKLYCRSVWPSQVTVIDPATNTVLANIATAYYPEAICFSTVDRKVYVAVNDCESLGTIEVLDGQGDTLLGEVDVGGMPWLLAYNASDDAVYAAVRGGHDVRVIDGRSDTIVDHLQIAEHSTALVYNVPHRKLYSVGSGGVVTAIDPGTHRTRTIDIGIGLDCHALGSSGSWLYVASRQRDFVYAIDCINDSIVDTIPVAGRPHSLCHNGRDNKLYSATIDDSGLVSVIDCAANRQTAVVPLCAYLMYFDYETNALYCSCDDRLSVVDCRTNTVTRTFDLNHCLGAAVSAPGWKAVYVCGYDPVLYGFTKPTAERAAKAAPYGQATIARGSLRWVGKAQAAVFDRTGRRVGDLHPGGNDIGRLAPGVYFVREAQAQAQARVVRKVVIAR
jgi:YVTN family beta-propeller protein